MNPTSSRLQLVVALVFIIGVAMTWTGCSTTAQERQEGQPATGPAGQTTAEGAWPGRFYLDDVRVPSELDYDPSASMVYETKKFKAGVLRFSKWRLDVQSIIDFFINNMQRDGWTFVNKFQGKETQLSFSKPDKSCIIRITESWTGTVHVLVAVGPLG